MASTPISDEACIGSISEIFDAEAPYHTARLHRPGLERRRSPAMLGKNRGVDARPLARLLVDLPGYPFRRPSSRSPLFLRGRLASARTHRRAAARRSRNWSCCRRASRTNTTGCLT